MTRPQRILHDIPGHDGLARSIEDMNVLIVGFTTAGTIKIWVPEYIADDIRNELASTAMRKLMLPHRSVIRAATGKYPKCCYEVAADIRIDGRVIGLTLGGATLIVTKLFDLKTKETDYDGDMIQITEILKE